MLLLEKLSILLVAILHVNFFILERFLWRIPLGHKIFKMSKEQAKHGEILAANQGVYNLLISFGLIFATLSNNQTSSTTLKLFLLLFIIGVGFYGTATVGKNIFFLQVIPALIALLIVFANMATPKINDISTSLSNIPKFSQESSFETNYNSNFKPLQLKYYEFIKPLRSEHSALTTFKTILTTAKLQKSWVLTNVDLVNFRIEGFQASTFLKFRDNFVIIVEPNANDTSTIQMRSKSQTGQSDFGVNATRIERFLKIVDIKLYQLH